MRTPTHVITSQGQYFGEVGHIIAGSNNLVKVTFLIHKTKKPVFIRREALLPLNPCDTTTQEVNVAQIESEAVYKAFMEVINELAAESKTLEQYKNVAAVHYVKGITLAIQHMSSKIAFKNYEPCKN
jgi:hypothetical protein